MSTLVTLNTKLRMKFNSNFDGTLNCPHKRQFQRQIKGHHLPGD